MLTNMTLRHDKFDTVGSEDSHWVRADTALDNHRIASQVGYAAYQHYVSPEYSGGGEGEPPSKAHLELRTRLVQHIRCKWQGGLFWMRAKREVVGVGARQQDRRPVAVGGTPVLDSGHVIHSLASLCGNSCYGDPWHLDAVVARAINPHTQTEGGEGEE